MAQKQYTEFFLGANTPTGFHSYFSDACPVNDGWNVFVIKGGPGSGKSTLMRRVAQEAAVRGFEYEHIYCSSDPDSLDGVIVTEIKTAIFDGTAPHVMEPKYPGVCEHIVNIGEAWSKARLRAQKNDIIELSSACSQHHAQAVRFLVCADSFRQNTELTASSGIDRQKIISAASRLAAKYAGKAEHGSGKTMLRLLSAVTPKGIVTLSDSINNHCDRIVPIIDRWYSPAALLMSELCSILRKNGHFVIDCRCSQCAGRTEHLILPETGTAFTTCSDFHSAVTATERAIHTERFISANVLSENRQKFSFNRKSTEHFTELAAEEMRRAKAVHDRLEECYISAMNFDIVNDIADRLCKDIFYTQHN